jgi:hypothetical protein
VHTLKALTLTQPWATLVAQRQKRFETRSWRTDHRGPLAIHAGKGLDPVGGREGLAQTVDRLPRGVIVAVANLTVVHRVEDVRDSLGGKHEGRLEKAFGDYTDGRWAWRLDDVVALPRPLECKGERRLWDVPLDLLDELQLQLARGLDIAGGGSSCTDCGCTDNGACDDGCYWVKPGLCSSCVEVLA